ncbi:MAG: restriction endonuclease [Gemmataceae bacterium]|nr:restriction endonuclease [Gemmataceae bacterium]
MPPAVPTARPLYGPADLAAAAAALDAARREWERFGLQTVGGDQVEAERARVEEARARLAPVAAQAGSWVFRARYHVLRAAGALQRLFGLEDRHAWVVAVLMGVAGTVAVAPLVLLFRPPAGPGAAVLLGAFVLTTAAGLAFILPAGRLGPTAAADHLRSERARGLQLAARLREELEDADRLYRWVAAAHRAQAQYVQAVDRHRRLEQLLTSERYHLLTTDWRTLRGVPFEEFLTRIFRLLGYQVQTTKASGDQGVDLIVVGKGRRIAVQAKGYEGSVGNKSVQEAFAGQTYYGCTACVVVTNSQFTSGAIELARRVGCQLIDGGQIPALIDGAIL